MPPSIENRGVTVKLFRDTECIHFCFWRPDKSNDLSPGHSGPELDLLPVTTVPRRMTGTSRVVPEVCPRGEELK